ELGLILGLRDFPDAALGHNPYGVAFSLARRDQLGLDPARLGRALDAVTDRDLRRVAAEVFAPGRHAGAVAGESGPVPSAGAGRSSDTGRPSFAQHTRHIPDAQTAIGVPGREYPAVLREDHGLERGRPNSDRAHFACRLDLAEDGRPILPGQGQQAAVR